MWPWANVKAISKVNFVQKWLPTDGQRIFLCWPSVGPWGACLLRQESECSLFPSVPELMEVLIYNDSSQNHKQKIGFSTKIRFSTKPWGGGVLCIRSSTTSSPTINKGGLASQSQMRMLYALEMNESVLQREQKMGGCTDDGNDFWVMWFTAVWRFSLTERMPGKKASRLRWRRFYRLPADPWSCWDAAQDRDVLGTLRAVSAVPLEETDHESQTSLRVFLNIFAIVVKALYIMK